MYDNRIYAADAPWWLRDVPAVERLRQVWVQNFVPIVPTPRTLGVDDWSFCRGRTYGTILTDLEQHHVVDLLPDRSAQTLKQWLINHPGVSVVSRRQFQAKSWAKSFRRISKVQGNLMLLTGWNSSPTIVVLGATQWLDSDLQLAGFIFN